MALEAFGGGGFDIMSLFTKAASLAPQFDPFPMLQQLNSAGAPGMTAGIAPGEWDWLNNPVAKASMPAAVPIPGDPTKVQQGPLAGASILPTPPGANPGAAPLTPQQIAALNAMQPRVPEQTLRPPGAVAPPSGNSRALQIQSLTLPQAGTTPAIAPSLAQILGYRR